MGDPHPPVNRSLRLDVRLDVHLVVHLDVHLEVDLELHQFWKKDGNGTMINCFFKKINLKAQNKRTLIPMKAM